MPLVKDLVYVTTMDADQDLTTEGRAKDQAFKYAQRGPVVSEVMLSALLDKVPLSPHGTMVVVDLLPHVGDRALATYNYSKSVAAEGRGGFKHVVVTLENSSFPPAFKRSAKYAIQRVKNAIFKDWLSGAITLHEPRRQVDGSTALVPVRPVTQIPSPTEEQLKKVPGTLLAYKGLHSLPLTVCMVTGGKAVIKEERLQAPLWW